MGHQWSGSDDCPPPGLWTAVSLGVSSRDRKLRSLFLPRALILSQALYPHDLPKTPPPNTITGVKISTCKSGGDTNVWSVTVCQEPPTDLDHSRDSNVNGVPRAVQRDGTSNIC